MALITSFYGQQDDTAPLFDGSYQSTTQLDPCAPPQCATVTAALRQTPVSCDK